jgi:penicillin-binding protein 1A
VADLPPDLIAAFLAVEDDQFFSHGGVNPRAILRAAYLNARAGRAVQGGSTITQQLAKVYTGNARSLTRKLDEALLARRIERHYTKAQILEAYLNRIFLGAHAYGVVAAARRYFQKPLSALTLPEVALLAGLAVAPSRLNPRRHPDAARARRDLVLRRMAQLDLVDPDALAVALATPLNLAPYPPPVPPAPPPQAPAPWPLAPDMAAVVRAALRDRWPHLPADAFERLDVQAELRLDHQRAARAALSDQALSLAVARGDSARLLRLTPAARARYLAAAPDHTPPILTPGAPYLALVLDPPTWAAVGPHRLRLHPSPSLTAPAPDDLILLTPRRAAVASLEATPPDADPYPLTHIQGAFAALDLGTGALTALVGALDPSRSPFNRALRACRPPGSVFKVVPFALALSRGFTPASVLSDAPVTLTDRRGRPLWTPRNADRDHRGPILLAQAFASSRNIPAIELVMRLTPQAVAAFARRLGLRAHALRPSPTLALGSDCVQPLEMVAAFAPFARDGLPLTPEPLRMVWRRGDPRPLLDRGDATDPFAPLDLRLIRALDPPKPAPPADADAPVVSAVVAYQMRALLRRVVTHGTARAALLPHLPLAGKTGTAGLYDLWFVGFSPSILAGVWLGDDRNRAPITRKGTAADFALPPWLTWMRAFSPPAPPSSQAASPLDGLPPPPARVEVVPIDPATGLRAHPKGPHLLLPFAYGTAPDRQAPSPTQRQAERAEQLEREF